VSDRRKRLIAVAHIGAAQCGVDEATRRAVQERIAGVASCADMDERALERVIRYWQRAGARVTLPGPLVRAHEDRLPLLRKIARQCEDLGRPWPEYALGIARQMLGHKPDRIEWLPAPALRKIVAALAYQQRRRDARGAARD
jgi:phage gp16-like protein